MNEFTQLESMVLDHSAWKNQFFERANEMRISQLRRIAAEYYYVTAGFPSVLAELIARKEVDEDTRFYLVEILYSELGSGIPAESHARLFRQLCYDVGLTDDEIALAPQFSETRELVDGLKELYRSSHILSSLGGQYVLEFQAENMLRSFRGAFTVLEHHTGASRGMKFFEIHDEVEPAHVQAMRHALLRHMQSADDMPLIRTGAKRCLDLFGQFWTALGREVGKVEITDRTKPQLAVVRSRK